MSKTTKQITLEQNAKIQDAMRLLASNDLSIDKMDIIFNFIASQLNINPGALLIMLKLMWLKTAIDNLDLKGFKMSDWADILEKNKPQ